MNTNFGLNYRRPFSFAIAFHIILLLSFLFRFNFDDASQASSSIEVVQATLVTEMPAAPPVNAPVLAPQEKSSRIEPQKEHLEEKTVVQKEAEKTPLLEETQRVEKAAIEKQQKLQAEIQQQFEKEQQQEKAQARIKKQQKEIEQLLQQDLVESSSVKSSEKSASVAAKASSTSSGIDNKEIDRYKSLIISAISQRWIVPENLKKGLACRLKVRVAPGGVVMNVKLVQSSGDAALDRSAQSAIYKASPLPVPKNTALFHEFREFNLTARPEGILAE